MQVLIEFSDKHAHVRSVRGLMGNMKSVQRCKLACSKT